MRPGSGPALSAKPSAAKIDWPPPVRDYVGRAFAADTVPTSITKEDISNKLKSIITEAAESNRLETIDWPNYPLPSEILQHERAAATQQTNNLAFLVSSSRLSTSSKKRKSMDVEMHDDPPAASPWKKLGDGLAERVTYPDKTAAADKRHKKATDQFRAGVTPSKLTDLEKRRQRFDLGKSGGASLSLSSSRDIPPIPATNSGHVVGTCQKLEKNYFRLTAPPKPEMVRPLPVMQKALAMIIDKWRLEHNYGYICDQFKSLRQDLTVQHIKNGFTVKVYESHARIALEKGDVGEYNQCQTQLKGLYKHKLGGNPAEFTAYRILYFLYTCNRAGMNDVLAELTSQDKKNPTVKHALETRAALATSNYYRFFRLYNQAPNMGAYLMDMFVDRERVAALAAMCKAYVYVSPGILK